MRLFQLKTLLEVIVSVFINLTSGWFGVTLISPGFFGVTSQDQYFTILLQNLPFGIIGLVFSAILLERTKL